MIEGEPEVVLAGGHTAGRVVRVGGTVRKPWTVTTPNVHAYLRALRAGGLDVPAVLGRDEAGRQVLEHVPGTLAMHAAPLDHDGLHRVGGMVRRLHDASERLAPDPEDQGWSVLLPPPVDRGTRPDGGAPGGARLLCHHDLAPWNLVIGERWVFIDWDGAGPSTRSWDLAYAAQTFTLNDPEADPREAAERLAALVEGYDPDAGLRATLPEALVRRPTAMRDHLAAAAAVGTEPWASMHREGHGAHWAAVSRYVAEHVDRWRVALAG